MAPSVAKALALARKMFVWERLPEPPSEAAPRRSGPGLIGLIFGGETLPVDPVREPSRRPRLPGTIFAREELPLDPVQPRRGRTGFFSVLVSRETLPQEATGPSRHRSRWLAWLFSPERVDPS